MKIFNRWDHTASMLKSFIHSGFFWSSVLLLTFIQSSLFHKVTCGLSIGIYLPVNVCLLNEAFLSTDGCLTTNSKKINWNMVQRIHFYSSIKVYVSNFCVFVDWSIFHLQNFMYRLKYSVSSKAWLLEFIKFHRWRIVDRLGYSSSSTATTQKPMKPTVTRLRDWIFSVGGDESSV